MYSWSDRALMARLKVSFDGSQTQIMNCPQTTDHWLKNIDEPLLSTFGFGLGNVWKFIT